MLYMRCRDGGPPLAWLLALRPAPGANVSALERLRALWGDIGAQSLAKLLRGRDMLGDSRMS